MTLSGNKELHYFDRFLHTRFTDEDAERYPAREFTPGYLRWPWVPALVRRACPDALLIVILRDPVERFFSAMKWRQALKDRGKRFDANVAAADAVWGGMYAHHLRVWASVFPHEQIHVEQYERAVEDPPRTVKRIWARLNLDPVPLSDLSVPSWTTTSDRNPWAGMRESLRVIYEDEIGPLEEWGIETRRWANFRISPL